MNTQILPLIFIFILIIFFGCGKLAEKKEEKLVGTWTQVIPLSNEPIVEDNWVFEEGNIVIANHIRTDTTFADTGNYSVKYGSSRPYLVIENLDYWLNGTYLVLKQNKEMLLLQRTEAEFEGAFYRREFMKK